MPTELHRTWVAHGPLAVLIAATDPARLRELHPLVTEVSDIRPDGDGERWTIAERVPLGPFALPNRYAARRTRARPDRLVLEAWSRPDVHLVHTLDVAEVPEGLRVEHTVVIEAPWWVRGFVVATARKAHDEWIVRVRTWVAAEAVRRELEGDDASRCTEPYRAGTRLVRGARGGRRWEVLVSENGPAFVRFPGVGPATLHLAPVAAFGRGGLDGALYEPPPAGHRFDGWRLRGPLAALDALPEWITGALLADPGGGRSIVDGALVVVAREPARVFRELEI